MDLLQFAATLALPLLVFAGLIWLLFYSAVRLALRHEVTKIERRKARRVQAQSARPRVIRTQPASAQANVRARQGNDHARPRPIPQRAAAEARTAPLARQRTVAS